MSILVETINGCEVGLHTGIHANLILPPKM